MSKKQGMSETLTTINTFASSLKSEDSPNLSERRDNPEKIPILLPGKQLIGTHSAHSRIKKTKFR